MALTNQPGKKREKTGEEVHKLHTGGRIKPIIQPTTAVMEVPLPRAPTLRWSLLRPGGCRGEWRRRLTGQQLKILPEGRLVPTCQPF